MEPEHEVTLAYQAKIEVGKDIELTAQLCNFQVHLQQISLSSKSAATNEDAAAAAAAEVDLYHLCLVPKFGATKGKELVLCTFDANSGVSPKVISLDLLVSVFKPHAESKEGQSFSLRLKSYNSNNKKNNSNVSGCIYGLQITSLTAPQFIALKQSQKAMKNLKK